MEGSYGYIRYQLKIAPAGNWFTSIFKPAAGVNLGILQLRDVNLPAYNVSSIRSISTFTLFNLFFTAVFSCWRRRKDSLLLLLCLWAD